MSWDVDGEMAVAMAVLLLMMSGWLMLANSDDTQLTFIGIALLAVAHYLAGYVIGMRA